MKIVGILLLSTVAATAQQQPAQLFERAKQALPGRNGAHKAESLLREAFRSWDQSPNSKGIDYAQGSVLLGMILVGRNKNKEAQPLFERAIAIYDENPASTSPLDLALALELECSLVGERGAP